MLYNKSMGKKVAKSIHLLSFLCVFSLTSCNASYIKDETIKITLVETSKIILERTIMYVKKGEDLSFTLKFEDNYTLETCSYDGYAFDEETNLLTLKNVNYPERVYFTTINNGGQITYDLNGGRLIDSNNDSYIQKYPLGYHFRVNTLQGVSLMEKEGCLLTGWNISANDDSTHVGLGSRYFQDGLEEAKLYAEWTEVSPLSYFQSAVSNDKLTLTKYLGPSSIDELVLPEKINGRKVEAIAKGFASNIKGSKLVISPFVETIQEGAFSDIDFETIMFYDSLVNVSDASFGGFHFENFLINAATSPRYTGENNALFTEIMDRIILNQDKKMMVFFAGCSNMYGLNSPSMQEAYPDYFVQNCGVIGGSNAKFQLDILNHYLKAGDVLVHSPEIASEYQLLHNTNAEYRMYVLVENNYDLLQYSDTKHIDKMFDAYGEYATTRSSLDERNYNHKSENTFNEYGDIIIDRPNIGNTKSLSKGTYNYNFDYLNDDTKRNMLSIYQGFADKGIKVLFSYSPHNKAGLTTEQIADESWDDFASFFETFLPNNHISVISDIDNYLMDATYFYDEDYHLNNDGVAIRTAQLIEDLSNYV